MLRYFLLVLLVTVCGVYAQMQPILRTLQSITPPPFKQPEDWNGTEYRYNRLIFRPAQFKVEAVFIVGIFIYIICWWIGKFNNYRRAMAWYDAHLPIFKAQFSSPTTKSTGLIQDGAGDFFNYSTGRRAVASLHTTAALLPRHDVLSFAFEYMWTLYDLTWTPCDEIQLDFTLLPSNPTPPFVWAIIKKNEMAQLRRSRWDLTFTKASDSPLLPPDLCVFSEVADITESILKFTPAVPLAKLLQDPTLLKYFRSLVISDQPSERPRDGPIPPSERSRHVILTLHSPPPSEARSTIPLVEIIFTLIDILDSKLPLRPETKTKLKARRDEVDEELRKEVRKERDEEQEEAKRAAKRKAEEDKLSRLSAPEQKKLEEKERKKALRKQQGKLVSRK